MADKNSIILIGMPGSGKSTVGIILAKLTGRDLLDTDILIQLEQGRALQEIVDHEGHLALREIEQRVLLGIDHERHVISTGGSAVYSEAAMNHLKSLGPLVFLDVALPVLQQRIRNFDTRGLAKRPEQTLEDLFAERRALYQKHADITINGNSLTQEEMAEAIAAALP